MTGPHVHVHVHVHVQAVGGSLRRARGKDVTEDTSEPAAFDRRTTDHEEIRAWIEARDGQPVVRQDPDTDRLAVTFGALDRPIETPVGYDRFFERFEATDRLFAYRTSADDPAEAYALFDRTRVAASNRLGGGDDGDGHGSAGGQTPHAADPGAGAPLDEDGGTGGSEPRHEAAREGANPDDHRDEPPHMS